LKEKEIAKKFNTSLIAVDAFIDEHKKTINKQEVLLLEDVAKLLDVSIQEIKSIIENEPARFPNDFLFVTLDKIANKNVLVFTLAGVFMLAGQIRNEKADKISIQLIELLVSRKPNIGFDLVMGLDKE
jgi:hypothetical protein